MIPPWQRPQAHGMAQQLQGAALPGVFRDTQPQQLRLGQIGLEMTPTTAQGISQEIQLESNSEVGSMPPKHSAREFSPQPETLQSSSTTFLKRSSVAVVPLALLLVVGAALQGLRRVLKRSSRGAKHQKLAQHDASDCADPAATCAAATTTVYSDDEEDHVPLVNEDHVHLGTKQPGRRMPGAPTTPRESRITRGEVSNHVRGVQSRQSNAAIGEEDFRKIKIAAGGRGQLD